MSAVMEAVTLPSFIRAHTPWNPKARVRGEFIEIRCAGATFTVPHTGDAKKDSKAASDAVRTYAKAHGWEEVV